MPDDAPPPPPGDDDDRPDDPVEGDDPAAPPLPPAVVHRFLATTRALSIARRVIRKVVPREHVEDLVTEALVSALKAPPPRKEAVLPAWFAVIARRRAADWLRKNKRRAKYEGPMPVPVEREDDYTGEAIDADGGAEPFYDPTTDEAPARLLGEELDHVIGAHPRDLEVRAMIRENSEGKTYAQIAKERNLTEAQVANRVLRFKVKYSARVQRRRQLVLFFKVRKWTAAAVVAAIVIAVLYFLLRPRAEDIRPDPSLFEPRPSPSASASIPVFLQALPPPPDPSATPDESPRKPQPPKP